MPDWTKLVGNLFDISFTIGRRAVSVTLIRRKGTAPPANQTVFLASDRQPSEVAGAAGRSGQKPLILVGYRGYVGQTDFDVAQGDTFNLGPNEYRVTYVDDTTPGRREAYCEATSK